MLDASKMALSGVLIFLNTFRLIAQSILKYFQTLATLVKGLAQEVTELPVIRLLFEDDAGALNRNLKDAVEERRSLVSELADIENQFSDTFEKDFNLSTSPGVGFGLMQDGLKEYRASLMSDRQELLNEIEDLDRKESELLNSAESRRLKELGGVYNPNVGEFVLGKGKAELQKKLREAQELFTNIAEIRPMSPIGIQLSIKPEIDNEHFDDALDSLMSIGSLWGRGTAQNVDAFDMGLGAFSSFWDVKPYLETEQKIKDVQAALELLGKTKGPKKAAEGINKLKESAKDVDKETGEMINGILHGMEKALDSFKKLDILLTDLGKTITNELADSLSSFFDDVASGSAAASDAFRAFGRTILQVINDIMAQQIVSRFMSGLLGIMSPTQSLFTNSAGITSSFPHPDSASWTHNVTPFSTGGIVHSPTRAIIGEGGMSEAVVPLPNGKSIPVDMRGNRGGEVININISAVDGVSVQRMLSSEQGRRAIQNAVRDARTTRRDLR